MKIPSILAPSPWPTTKAGVLAIAHDWYDDERVAVDMNAIAALDLPAIPVGADATMAAGKLGMEWAESAQLSVALNSINYQFWDLGEQGQFIRYDHEGVVGALGMRQAFERAWADPDSPLSRARRGSPLTLEDIHAMFGDIPAAQSRVDVLNEVLCGQALPTLARDITQQMQDMGMVGTELAHRLAEAFPLAYGDLVLKKAQLAVSELWVKARDSGMAIESDLTAFADYQIPNILRAMGVLNYAPDLAHHIDSLRPLDYDSHDERAIRAASLLAVEHIAQATGTPVAAVDHYLWTRRKEATTPFHLTFTTAY